MEITMSVRVERSGAVTTVIMNRPEARNAVNGPTAAELFAAFDEFDRDDSASVAVLWGDNGTFCAGADLKAFGTPDVNPAHRSGPGPMGPTRMVLSKPVIAAVSGYAVAGGLELALWCDLGSSKRSRHGCLLPALGRSADRRRHRPAATADRAQPGDGHDPDRPRRRRRRGARDGSGQPRRAEGPGPGEGRGTRRGTGRATAAVHAVRPHVPAQPVGVSKPRRWTSNSAACRGSRKSHWRGRSASPRAPDATAHGA